MLFSIPTWVIQVYTLAIHWHKVHIYNKCILIGRTDHYFKNAN